MNDLLEKIDHLGVAVKSIESALKFYRDTLGIEPTGIEEVPSQKVKVAFLPVGESNIELLESTTVDGPIARHIEKRGEGIAHLAFRVNDIESVIASLKEKGVRLLSDTAQPGAHGAKIVFIHPKSANGILIELCER
ncbi:methylmalonyl-CoA epimerase [Clostridium sp. 'deep sea']|jgi:methylmalonyl-CoA/ethylmalonyl-CoA epimerase|uniref:methylmalonyl-CoA epimerase n=1 Tax=Clostridium sp. 'deep sea' TaxID=2779445 RepID=UPI0018965830|nr:methylmalonyl-CoA epimerase [Clostridium sp. 'deep sea']QOR35784.1 methylmalonyl-CoA epimerase [Clostridium sp. 'deep sea']